MRSVVLLFASVVSLAMSQEWVDMYGLGQSQNYSGFDITMDQAGWIYAGGVAPISQFYDGPAIVRYGAPGTRSWDKVFRIHDSLGAIQDLKVAVSNAGVVAVAGYGFVSGDVSYFIAACNLQGESLWAHMYRGISSSLGSFDVAADGRGGVYLCRPEIPETTGGDIRTTKYRPDGQVEWTQLYDGPRHSDDFGRAVAVDTAGNAYVAGQTYNALGKQKPFILKYGTDGTLLRVVMFGTQGNNDGTFHDIALATDGSVYAAGEYAYLNQSPIARYSASLDSLWNITVSGWMTRAAVDRQGNLFATGRQGPDYSTWKFSSTGSQLWNRIYDGPAHGTDIPTGIAVDDSGNAYVTGQSPSTSVAEEATVKYSSAGQERWVSRCHYWTGMYANGLTASHGGDCYVTGFDKDTVGPYRWSIWITKKYRPTGPGGQEEAATSRPSGGGGIRVSPTVVARRCRFTLPARARATGLRILDASGRAVWGVPTQAGETTVIWDATDEAGLPVPNGVYFVTLEGAGSRSATKFIIQR